MVGMVKDEAGGKIIEDFVDLRAKLCSMKMHVAKKEKNCKGVKNVVVTKKITHEDYEQCLFSGIFK